MSDSGLDIPLTLPGCAASPKKCQQPPGQQHLADIFATELYGQDGYTHFVDDHTRDDDRVLAKVTSGLQVTGMQDFAAWVLGDKIARLFGADPVGLPTGAGYAAGVRLVGEYLRLHGGTAASNVHALAETILSDVLPRLGLGNE